MAVYQWRGMYRGGGEARGESAPCLDCGLPHTTARRHAVLLRMLPATSADVTDAWPHLWPATHFGRGVLWRDLRDVGAVRGDDGEWRLP